MITKIMDIEPDYALVKKIRETLSNMDDVEFGLHAEERLKHHGIDKRIICALIEKPINLMHVEVQKDSRSEKHKLVFRKSGKYDYVVVIRFASSSLKVITARIQNKKRIKLNEKWRMRLYRRRGGVYGTKSSC
ncbi:MAG: hypothetical protein KAJ91_03120 [Candidatus Aenigmarchaeota archaeon]|nr:hypothetical protein [Candidatus Aenigmarchaeota archaeon]